MSLRGFMVSTLRLKSGTSWKLSRSPSHYATKFCVFNVINSKDAGFQTERPRSNDMKVHVWCGGQSGTEYLGFVPVKVCDNGWFIILYSIFEFCVAILLSFTASKDCDRQTDMTSHTSTITFFMFPFFLQSLA
jgi:hypothetical protein